MHTQNVFNFRMSVFAKIWVQLLCAFLVSLAFLLAKKSGYLTVLPSLAAGNTALASILGFLVAFRNNVSHQRYNEAALAVAQATSGLRAIGIVCTTTADLEPAMFTVDPDSKKSVACKEHFLELFHKLQVLFAAIIEDLHGQPMDFSLEQCGTEDYHGYHSSLRPVVIAAEITRLLHQMVKRSGVNDKTKEYAMKILQDDVMKGWERLSRIVNSPTPFMYRHLIASLLFVYIFTFPLAYLGVLGDAVVPVTVVIAGALFGISQVSDEMENPLGDDVNDINLHVKLDELRRALLVVEFSMFGSAASPPAVAACATAESFRAAGSKAKAAVRMGMVMVSAVSAFNSTLAIPGCGPSAVTGATGSSESACSPRIKRTFDLMGAAKRHIEGSQVAKIYVEETEAV